jgi:glycosyltransferase involved in cell wall biosynthesis
MCAERLPSVSVVVPVLNAEATIGDLLASIARLDYPPDRREVIVVDNGSSDGTSAVLDGAPVRRLFEPRRGTARARNRGIEASRGEIVAFTDADCVVTTGWLRALVEGFDGPGVGGVAGEILAFPPRTAAERHAARIRHLSPQRYLRRPLFPFAVTANLAFRREVFDRVGLLDPDSPRGGESTDFCTRFFRQTGLELKLASRAVVFHRHRATAADLFLQQWGYGRGHAYLYDKYRADIAWTWRQRVGAWGDVGSTAGKLAAAAGRRACRRGAQSDIEFHYFELIRKLGARLGFLWHRASRPASACWGPAAARR